MDKRNFKEISHEHELVDSNSRQENLDEADNESKVLNKFERVDAKVAETEQGDNDKDDWELNSRNSPIRLASLDNRVDLKRENSSSSSDREPVQVIAENQVLNTLEKEEPHLSTGRIQEQEIVPSLGEFLKMRVAFAGQNIEKSIRKMIALTRAILEKPKLILLYEEAINCGYGVAYNIDVLKTRCPESTVMSITRSNRNIHSYDQIILMDGGMIIDQGDPMELISQEQSHFYNYLKETDHETFLQLKRQMETKKKT